MTPFCGFATLVDRRGAELGDAPLVSVVVPLFEHAAFIGECLDSVAAQTHRALDLIVVDDASRDASAAAAQAWLEANAGRFARARLVRHARNAGLSRARNTGFALAKSEYVFVLDADNALLPRAVQRHVETLAASPAGAAYAQLVYFGDRTGLGEGDVWRPEQLQRGNYVDAMALVRKTAWARVGGYRPMEFGWEDFDFWCRFVEAGIEAVFIPELLVRYRVRAASMLRAETQGRFAEVVHAMMAAHPWLDIRA